MLEEIAAVNAELPFSAAYDPLHGPLQDLHPEQLPETGSG
jgi:hypothetical protein